MKTLATIFFAAALISLPTYGRAASPLPAQSRCTLTEAPTVRGLQLGMSIQQLLALFPGSSKRSGMSEAIEAAKSSSLSEPAYLSFDPATDASGGQFANVIGVAAGIHKQRVVDFSILFIGATWSNIDQWVAKLSETFRLPGVQAWTIGMSETPNKVLKCTAFEIEASIQGDSASIRIRNLDSKNTADEARMAEDKKRRDFKP